MDDEARWTAVVERDERTDGAFVFGVVTTRVYCRPSCPARRPLRRNVRFYESPVAAERDGLRACQRCEPRGPGPRRRRAELVADACRLLAEGDPAPPLAEVARQLAVSPSHLRRSFRAETGLAPKAYAMARRASRTRDRLAATGSITAVAFDAGFSSTGPFYAESRRRLGMTPRAFRAAGAGEVVRIATARSSLGPVVVAVTVRGVCAIELGDDIETMVADVAGRFHAAEVVHHDPDVEHLVAEVVALVDDPRAGTDLPLDVRGTAFQERVWRALSAIAPGETLSYAALAERLDAPSAARAVASACAANQLAVAVPCHRVVRADGELAGYRWGLERKAELLRREQPPPES